MVAYCSETAGRWAIIPVKHLALAKSRLSDVLGDDRATFMRRLAQKTLATLIDSGLFENIVVVTADPLVTSDALAVGAATLVDWDDDLNGACRAGLCYARKQGAAACMIVPADLALLDRSCLVEVIAAFDAHRALTEHAAVGLVRCKEGTGTTIAIMDAAADFIPAYGADSFARHMRSPHVRPIEIVSRAAAFDIDTPADLDALAQIQPTLGLRRTVDPAAWTLLELNDEHHGAINHAA